MLKIVIVYFLYFVKGAFMQQSCEAENQYDWSYHGPDNDPSRWGDSYPECNGIYQSPVAIIQDDKESIFPELQYYGFDKPITKAKMQNLGWTVIISPEDNVHRYIDWFDEILNLRNIQFHFGSESDPGAQHVVNGVRYPMEISYIMHDDEVNITAILSTLMDATDDDNSAFNPITEALPNIMYRDDSTDLQSELDLSKLLPEDTYYFWIYAGSISHPPCEPYAKRFVLKDIGKVGGNQLDTFMKLYSVGEKDASDDCLMGPNYRPVQDNGDDPIFNGPINSEELRSA